jgi:hypothetical protein
MLPSLAATQQLRWQRAETPRKTALLRVILWTIATKDFCKDSKDGWNKEEKTPPVTQEALIKD